VPNYGARLRRARLGLICGIATVSMVFYFADQRLRGAAGAAYVRWRSFEFLCAGLGPRAIALAAAGINTALLLISS
jgi:hypothetical protein